MDRDGTTGAVRGGAPARRRVVVSQPMYFPWVGMLQQIRLCDAFVYYDDVQFSRGFFNRVQVKTRQGVRWLTVPLQDWHRGQRIDEVRIANGEDWQRGHRDLLAQAYADAPYRNDMLAIVDAVFARDYEIIGDLARASMDALVRYYPAIGAGKPFLASSSLGIAGASTERLVDICAALDADRYLTGHGARHYLQHEAFEARGMQVEYIDYALRPYPQAHGEFTPYVSALDLVANLGPAGITQIDGAPLPWRDFIGRHATADHET